MSAESSSHDIHAAWNSAAVLRHESLLAESFARVTGRLLLEPSEAGAATRLFYASRVVVSHGTEADPVLNYGNRAALTLWEMDWERLTRTPSRLTAEPLERDERARLLEQVTRNGFIDNYRGVRISASGRRFNIEQAVVWNVVDAEGRKLGQAATFERWTFL